jgi:putative FmdB family regulatory protein
MPFYEYQCESCGHTLEAMQKVNDSPLKKCPHCGKPRLTRLMSAPVFRLKGGGWYETDFKGEQDNKRNLADKPEAEPAKDDKTPAVEAKGDAAAKDGSKPADKAADKPSDKPAEKTAPAEPAKKPAGAGISKRGTAPAAKAAPKRARKKLAKLKGRR